MTPQFLTYAVAPNGVWSEAFDAATQMGLGSYVIGDFALPGDMAIGTLVFYDVHSIDPNAGGDGIDTVNGYQVQLPGPEAGTDGIATVTYTQETSTPEPAAAGTTLVGLALLAVGKRRVGETGPFRSLQLGYTDAVMNHRRAFLQTVAGVELWPPRASTPQTAETDRQYWVRTMAKVAEPVLTNLAAGTLKRNMPVECVTGERRRATQGDSPRGARPPAGRDGAVARSAARRRSRARPATALRRPGPPAIRDGADPQSPDFLNFHEGSQPLVDCGFLAQALLRAPNELWKKLDAATQKNLAAGLLSARVITPGQNNWLLFAATVEAALAMMGERFDAMRIDYAVRAHQQWYVGDGLYGDGPRFHWDYYNSFVIQPMLLDVLRNIGAHAKTLAGAAAGHPGARPALRRDPGAPDLARGHLPRHRPLHLLSHRRLSVAGADRAARRTARPADRPRVRAALTAVMKRLLDAPGTFDDGLADRGLRGPPAASRRELHLDRQPVPLRGACSCPWACARRRVLERSGGRLDVAAHLARRRRSGGPRDHGVDRPPGSHEREGVQARSSPERPTSEVKARFTHARWNPPGFRASFLVCQFGLAARRSPVAVSPPPVVPLPVYSDADRLEQLQRALHLAQAVGRLRRLGRWLSASAKHSSNPAPVRINLGLRAVAPPSRLMFRIRPTKRE